MTRCVMIDVWPDASGNAVERPCPNNAAFELGAAMDWLVCADCLRKIADEEPEEAATARKVNP